MNDINDKISGAFDDIITTLGSLKELDADVVEQQFCKLLGQITKLERSNKPLFYQYRHRYHLLRVSYFERINDINNATEEKEQVDHYAMLCKQFPIPEATADTSTSQKHLFNSESDNQATIRLWEDVLTIVALLTDLTDVKDIIRKLAQIHKCLETLFKLEVRTLDEYLKLQQNCTTILSVFKALQIGELQEATEHVEEIENTKSIEIVEIGSNYLDPITDLIHFIADSLENQQVSFANFLLSDIAELNTFLFDDVPQTTQCIRRRYHEWARIFHSDRHRSSPVFDELMKHINIIRDQYLSKISSQLEHKEKVKYELDEGHKHYQMSRKYKERCRNGNNPELTVTQLERLISNEALWAFEHYRAALKSLGKMKNESSEGIILQRVDILTYMGLVLRQARNYEIESQLYFVAGIYIITDSTMTTKLQNKLRELQSALQRYQQTFTGSSTNASKQVAANTTSRELVLCNTKTASVREIHDDTKVFLRENILRQCVLRSAQPTDLSTDVTSKTSNNQTHASLPILTRMPVSDASSPIMDRMRSLLDRFNLVKWKKQPKSLDLNTEHSIRQKLNEMMKAATDCYSCGENAKFIDSLSQTYYNSARLMDIKQSDETISLEIRSDQFIKPLLKHGFRADKVAHLMILVGEVLLRGLDFSDPKRKNPEHSALLEQSKILFQGIFDSKELRNAAEKLDHYVERYHHAKYRKDAAKRDHPLYIKDIEDSYDAPFVDRLNGYCRLARLNYAIACLLAAGKVTLSHTSSIFHCRGTMRTK